MGDIADMLVDQMIEQGMWGRATSRPKKVTCERCGKRNLEWGNDGRSWYLINRNADPHVCHRSTPEEDFA